MILLSFLVLIISGLANGLSNTNASSIFEIKAENIPRYKEEQETLTMIIAFSLVITSLLIAVFLYVIILQKIQKLGVLKAISMKNPYLAYDLVVQAVFLSVVALLVGTGLTLAFVQKAEGFFMMNQWRLIIVYEYISKRGFFYGKTYYN